ncbi:hypothetical protein M902_0581 [Bacteriovorax sp. BAL6_X]|uniref:hypothetical protein n=1 Tax=Bacteriovorax sp. BAL6_X TaxID=1201290 RepID=UPI000386D465|nr:hypothetical protein [Bacteriovorax sp. BAL6_X]EPZ49775.1 hypothetical protein M902_0581 [Bacteriovorax sp. BAL6_X]
MDVKKLIKSELGFDGVTLYIDKRSKFFFFMKYEKENFMVLLKNEIESEALPLMRKFTDEYPELPTLIKETDSLILYDIPNGKLARVVEEKVNEELAKQITEIQFRLNELTAPYGYHFEWQLNYFFITKNKLMYIDLETLEFGEKTKTIDIQIYDQLSLEERVKLKIKKENKRQSNHERFIRWLK